MCDLSVGLMQRGDKGLWHTLVSASCLDTSGWHRPATDLDTSIECPVDSKMSEGELWVHRRYPQCWSGWWIQIIKRSECNPSLTDLEHVDQRKQNNFLETSVLNAKFPCFVFHFWNVRTWCPWSRFHWSEECRCLTLVRLSNWIVLPTHTEPLSNVLFESVWWE